jgi:hypothetical protein
VTGGWRKLHNAELFTKCYYGDPIKDNEASGMYSRRGDVTYILVGKPEWKSPYVDGRC